MDIAERLKIVANYQHTLELRYHELGKAIGQLTAAGCIDAKEYWKDGKYLYLLYPMKHGQRKKTYIGNHPLRVEEARNKLRNYKARLELIQTREKVDMELRHIERLTSQLLQLCSSSDLCSRFALEDEKLGTDSSFSRRRIVPNSKETSSK